MTPQSLNELASEWQRFILARPHSQAEDTSKHVLGKHSVYEQRFDMVYVEHIISFYYIGATARENKRQSEHISEFVRCSVKTLHGKSSLYDPKYMDGVLAFKFVFTVLEGGFEDAASAEAREKELAAEYALKYTPEFMISNQNRGRGKDTRPRFKRAG